MCFWHSQFVANRMQLICHTHLKEFEAEEKKNIYEEDQKGEMRHPWTMPEGRYAHFPELPENRSTKRNELYSKRCGTELNWGWVRVCLPVRWVPAFISSVPLIRCAIIGIDTHLCAYSVCFTVREPEHTLSYNYWRVSLRIRRWLLFYRAYFWIKEMGLKNFQLIKVANKTKSTMFGSLFSVFTNGQFTGIIITHLEIYWVRFVLEF